MRSWGVLWKSNNNDDEGDNYVDIIKVKDYLKDTLHHSCTLAVHCHL